MGTEFTKGEWELDSNAVVSKNSPDGANIICMAPDKRYVSYEYWEHNAKLIAAAPEMLKLLRDISWTDSDSRHISRINELIKKATS